MNSEPLANLPALVEKDGQELQSLVDQPTPLVSEKDENDKPRAHVVEAYRASHEQYGELYKKLAQ